jgi:hypothetical protein
MRSYFLFLISLLYSSSFAFAAKLPTNEQGFPVYGMSGCGLSSSLLFVEPNNRESRLLELVSIFIDSYVPYKLSTITTGTLNCQSYKEFEIEEPEEVAARFIEDNCSSLAVEAAAGQGPHLFALMGSLGCEDVHADRFAEALQKSYGVIFGAKDCSLTPGMINAAVQADKVLRSSCTYTG